MYRLLQDLNIPAPMSAAAAKVRSASPGLNRSNTAANGKKKPAEATGVRPQTPHDHSKGAPADPVVTVTLHPHEPHHHHDPNHKDHHHHDPNHKDHHHHDGHIPHDGHHHPNGHHHHHHEPIKFCEEDKQIIKETEKHVEEIREKTVKEVRKEVQEEITKITAGVTHLLKKGQKDEHGCAIFMEGEHFLEEMIRKFESDFVCRWKEEFLFKHLELWLEKQMVKYIEEKIRVRSEEIIKTFQECIIKIEEEHRLEIIAIEEHHREVLRKVCLKAWAEYEKRMQDIEFKKMIVFKYHQCEERESFSEFMAEILPELKECVPRIYKPDFSFKDMIKEKDTIKG